MEFFNKKEEVIDLKLTQFGRHLLSKGKFKPVYYSFFDDNIMYDSTKAGFEEIQNDSEIRIIETPVLHPQISFSSLEKHFNENYNKVLSGVSATAEELQRTAEKHYALPQAIGTSDVNSEYSPAWSVRFLNGFLTGSVENLNLSEKTGGQNTQLIPQINSELTVKMLQMTDQITYYLEEMEDAFTDSNVAILSDDDDLFILLKVDENNGLFQKKNFDIEVFEVEEEVQGGTTIETLRPLNFSITPENFSEIDWMDEITSEEDVTHTDYYFDILVDDEISDQILCKLDPVPETMGVFADARTLKCQQIIDEQNKQVFDIYIDEADISGEVC